jgi:hypothetical protein
LGSPLVSQIPTASQVAPSQKNACVISLSIPDDDALHADLTSCGYKHDSSGRLVLESKQDMKKWGMPSPDSADAMALTFSEPEGSAIPYLSLIGFNREIEYPKWSGY